MHLAPAVVYLVRNFIRRCISLAESEEDDDFSPLPLPPFSLLTFDFSRGTAPIKTLRLRVCVRGRDPRVYLVVIKVFIRLFGGATLLLSLLL